MKKLTFIGLLIGTLAVGMIIGAYIGARLASRAFGMLAYSKPEVDMAANAAQEAEWLAEPRLGETNSAINEMENTLNIQVETLAAWDSVIWLDDKTRQARDRWLVPVKVYRESYPASGSDMARANALLSTIPGRSPTSTCKSGVCRLNEAASKCSSRPLRKVLGEMIPQEDWIPQVAFASHDFPTARHYFLAL